MKIITQIRFYLVVVTIAFVGLLVNYLNVKDELIKCQTDKGYIPGGDIEKAELMSRVDSLYDENFNKSTIIGRYEITMEHLKETYPKIGKETEEWMNHETE